MHEILVGTKTCVQCNFVTGYLKLVIYLGYLKVYTKLV